MYQKVYVLDEGTTLTKELKNLFKGDVDYMIKAVKPEEIDVVFKDIPELILINEDGIDTSVEKLCGEIRANEDNAITPIMVYSSNEEKQHKMRIAMCSAEFLVEKSMGIEFLARTIKNILRLLSVNRTVSPLTGLPGNVQIQTELKRRLLRKESFKVLYFDLDNFKAYNDVYGFLKGDEIIRFASQIIVKNVHEIENGATFVGHIGGDDFVAVLDGDANYDRVCQNIIAEFDAGVTKFFDEQDLERGFLRVPNRKGEVDEFPITTISIGVVVADRKRFANTLEIGEVGAQVKHLAKATMGSCYAINRRDLENN